MSDTKSATNTATVSSCDEFKKQHKTIVRSTSSTGWSGTVCDASGISREVIVKSIFALVSAYSFKA